MGKTSLYPWLAVAGLLIGAGLLHHSVHRSRAALASVYRPPVQPLDAFPARIGPYVLDGDVPLSDEILDVADVDTYLQRRYSVPDQGAPVTFYLGYWGYPNKGMGHGPDVCFPAGGWHPEGPSRDAVVRFSGPGGKATEAGVQLHRFSRMGPAGLERSAVAFVTVINGSFRPSSRGVFVHRPPESANDGFLAHVEALTPVAAEDWTAAEARLLSFMEHVLPAVADWLIVPDHASNGSLPGHRNAGAH